MMEKRITLFTPYFSASTQERQYELDYCMRRNLECDAVDRLILLIDDGRQAPFTHPKLEAISVDGRPTYKQWVQMSSEHARPGLSVLANSDIYFDETLDNIRDFLKAPSRFLALSRYDQLGSVRVAHPHPAWSQDVWAYDTDSEMPPSLIGALDIPLGVPRCDNKIAYAFAVRGWQLFNPMGKVRSVHVHETQQRSYNKKADTSVLGGVAYVHPSDDPDRCSRLDIDVWVRGAGAIDGVRLNRSLDHWETERDVAQVVAQVVDFNPSDAAYGRATNEPDPLSVLTSAPDARIDMPRTPYGSLPHSSTLGECVFEDDLGRFRVYSSGLEHWTWDALRHPCSARFTPQGVDRVNHGRTGISAEQLLAAFIKPVQETNLITVGERPTCVEDSQFWQYPAATERQAWQNHLQLMSGANVDEGNRIVHTYLGLPWATYIDKKRLPDQVIPLFAPRIRGFKRLAREFGYQLRVHTVCQQIYWRRLVHTWSAMGITDLHLSHATIDLDPEAETWPFEVHSWPLFAPNVEVPERREGLEAVRPIERRRYLASFIGAHMPHYRSDVRLRLMELAKESRPEDLLVDLGNEWHFDKVVYQEQVKHKRLSASEEVGLRAATRRYNEVLSDSVFSLCPEGAGPNTLRLWESLAVGAIPVILADGWAPPLPGRPGAPALADCAVFVSPSQISGMVALLRSFTPEELVRRQSLCIELYADARQRTAFPN